MHPRRNLVRGSHSSRDAVAQTRHANGLGVRESVRVSATPRERLKRPTQFKSFISSVQLGVAQQALDFANEEFCGWFCNFSRHHTRHHQNVVLDTFTKFEHLEQFGACLRATWCAVAAFLTEGRHALVEARHVAERDSEKGFKHCSFPSRFREMWRGLG